MIINRFSFHPRNEFDRRLVIDRAEVVFVGCVWIVLFICIFLFGHKDEARVAPADIRPSHAVNLFEPSYSEPTRSHSERFLNSKKEVKNAK